MKKVNLFILSHLVILLFITTLAYSADLQIPPSASPDTSNAPAEVVAVKSASLVGIKDTSLANLMLNILDSDMEYRLDESSTIVLAYSPFAAAESDDHSNQMVSKISLGLKFTFWNLTSFFNQIY